MRPSRQSPGVRKLSNRAYRMLSSRDFAHEARQGKSPWPKTRGTQHPATEQSPSGPRNPHRPVSPHFLSRT